MKIINKTNKTIKPVTVSVMVKVKGREKRFELAPGEFIYSNGIFSELFNQSLRVQKQKGLIDVLDENDLEQISREKKEEEEQLILKQQEEEEKLAAAELAENAFDNTEFFEESLLHPDLIIVDTKKEPDYSSNVLPDPEEEIKEEKSTIEEFPIYTTQDIIESQTNNDKTESIVDKVKKVITKKNKNEKKKK